MIADYTTAQLVDALGGLAMAALGVTVLALGWHRPVNRWFAFFATSFGSAFVAGNLLRVELGGRGLERSVGVLLFGAFMIAASVAIVGLVLSWPRGPRPLHAGAVAWTALPGLGLLAASTYVYVAAAETSAIAMVLGEIHPATHLAIVAQFGFLGAQAMALLVLALRVRSAPRGHPVVHQASLLAMALLLYWAVVAGGAVFSAAATTPLGPGDVFVQGVHLVLVALVSATWLWAGGSGPHARHARVVAWTAPAIAIVGLLWVGHFGLDLGLRGITRVATALLLAYGILRHQLLGIDVKVKWTLKQSTIAAIFLATIFLVSEGAQLVFGEEQAWLGLVAGGVLVFALAPLQRFAEGVADKAMPGVKAVGDMSEGERLALYRRQLEAAYADGSVDASERRMLESAREALGIDGDAALALEAEVAH